MSLNYRNLLKTKKELDNDAKHVYEADGLFKGGDKPSFKDIQNKVTALQEKYILWKLDFDEWSETPEGKDEILLVNLKRSKEYADKCYETIKNFRDELEEKSNESVKNFDSFLGVSDCLFGDCLERTNCLTGLENLSELIKEAGEEIWGLEEYLDKEKKKYTIPDDMKILQERFGREDIRVEY